MDILIFYIFSFFYLNNSKLILENSQLIKDNRITFSAKEIENFIKDRKELKSINSPQIRESLVLNNIYSYQVLPFISLKNNINLSDDLKIFLSLNSNKYNKIGYYYGEKYLVVLLINELINLNIKPLKKKYRRYDYIKILGQDVKNNIKSFTLYINTPTNKIKKIFLPIINNKFNLNYKLKEKGRYVFEIIDENKNDPIIISKLSINVGKNINNLPCNNEIKNNATLLKDINRIRINNGLKKIEELKSLSKISYFHSKDMAENNFFSHLSSDGETPYKRVKKEGIKFKKILENISQSPKLCLAHNEILESPGHLNNLLDDEVNKIGLGIYQKDDSFYLTEDFILLDENKSLEEYKNIFLREMTKLDIINNDFLNGVSKIKNYNEFYLATNIPKKMPIYIREFKSIKSYFFIIKNFDSEFINELQDIHSFDYYGYNFSIFKINNQRFLFLTIILANL
jgi:hypothetical protein